VGYQPFELQAALNNDTLINVRLERSSSVLQEVSVISSHNQLGVKGSQMSAIEIPVEQIKAVPAFLGEVDVIKALQLLPGVQSGAEASAGFYVRGGGSDENLILLDEIPVYNVNHFFGFFSIFNTDALKSVTLYKGSFPARFGERLSSVIDIRMKDGDSKKFHGGVSVGLISAKLNFEGPIIKDKTTFSLSGRRTYFDVLAAPALAILNKINEMNITAGYYFYDVNAKITHKFSDKDKLYLSFYMGDDAIYVNNTDKYNSGEYYNAPGGEKYSVSNENLMKMNWKWGNLITALRWNHIINNQIFMNITTAYTRYRFSMKMNSEEKTFFSDSSSETNAASILYSSSINDFNFKTDFDYKPNSSNDIKFGLNYVFHHFSPEVMTMQGSMLDEDFNLKNSPMPASELSIYAEDNVSLGKRFKINGGLRYSAFFVQKRFYNSIQPRLSARFLVTEDFSLKTGYSYMSQYIHLLSNSNISLPTDLWVPVTKRIAPMNTHQVAFAGVYNLKNIVEFSLEGYYKSMDNILEYKDGASFFGFSTGWEDKVVMGRGWSYGMEFMVSKTVGKTTGWIAYTLAKSERLFNRPGQEINFGNVFPAKFDRRHDISITATHKFNNKIDIGATWVFSTGNACTLGLQSYSSGYVPDDSAPQKITYIESRNNYRFAPYHRLDVGVNFHKKKKYGTRTWNISFYNIYNRQNPFIVLPETDSNGQQVLKQISIFPIIPSVSYSYKF
ncbi:MAG: TonB-dependent receptor plug domain-containing protein, partial [Prevotellaceae bacterium]|nr:TonB-dependent receptor plug domain-containing protein [Prevotellaceae bacterium]